MGQPGGAVGIIPSDIGMRQRPRQPARDRTMSELPTTCEDCGNDELDTWSTTVDRGPTNTTGSIVNQPSPNYESVPATAVVCPNCEWTTTILRDQGGR